MRERALLKVAERILSIEEAQKVVRSFDVIGDIAVIKLPNALEDKKHEIARELMKEIPHIKTVFMQASPVHGEYRVRSLEWLAGEKRTTSIHREHGCSFEVDLSKVYFSPRLIHERWRIAGLVNDGETVVNMFAGVGCYSIIIAKRKPNCLVYSIDVNPAAVELMKRNVTLNNLSEKVIPIEGDAREQIEGKLRGLADRVLMPLPEKAYEYLDAALTALKGEGYIHYYDFIHAKKGENPLEKTWAKVHRKLIDLNALSTLYSGRVVRSIGPNWYQVALDISIALNKFKSKF
jgi:tRNA (guanine37-N1)-methyltransferase